MKPSVALSGREQELLEIVARHRATQPRVFGSVARGEDVDGSDLDLLVEVLPGTTLFDLGGLQIDLEEMLGVRVDLVTAAALPLAIRHRVLSHARTIESLG